MKTRKRPSAAALRRRQRTDPKEREAAAASVDDASLRALARALLVLAEELTEREEKQG
jgi:hypothetical protein